VSELSYCGEQVERYDRDRYMTCLFAPEPRRERLFALYAFNLEIAKTAEVVSEPMLGEIRLQWWRDAVAGIYDGNPRAHAVVGPLAEAVAAAALDRGLIDSLIDARARDLDAEAEAPPTLAALEAYAEGTSGNLARLALAVMGAEGGAAEAAGRHAGIAWALTGLARAVPFHARQKRCYLPEDLMGEAGLGLGELYELRSSPALARVVGEIANRAGRHLAEARAHRRGLPRSALPALLPVVLAQGYLTLLARRGHDPFDPAVQAGLPGGIWRLAWAWARRRY
jgi:phytoene synthase